MELEELNSWLSSTFSTLSMITSVEKFNLDRHVCCGLGIGGSSK